MRTWILSLAMLTCCLLPTHRAGARATTFREACRKRLTYDIDYYFDMVDKNPNSYQRN